MKFKILKEPQKKCTFEDLLNSPYGWEDTDETFVEDLYCSKYDDECARLEEEWNKQPFKPGDIIMVNNSVNSSSGSNFTNPHRVYILTSVVDENGTQTYTGYELSSNRGRSNKYIMDSGNIPSSDWWKSNIYIDDYSTIVTDTSVTSKKDVFIDLETLYEFTNKELSSTGVKKGTATPEFSKFVLDVLYKLLRGEDTSMCRWENGIGVLE